MAKKADTSGKSGTVQRGNSTTSAEQKEKTPPKTAEDKVNDFKRLASKRTEKAVQRILMIQHLSNASSYTYTAEQVAAVIGELKSAVAVVERAFAGKKNARTPFQL